MNLEAALEYIGDDELVRSRRKNVRMRKIHLDETISRRAASANE